MVVLSLRSGSREVLGFGTALLFVTPVVTSRAVFSSVLATSVAMVGVSSVIDCVVATMVIKGGRTLRTVVGLDMGIVAEVVVVVAAVVEVVVAIVLAVAEASRAAVLAVVPSAFRMVTTGASVTLGM